MGGAVQRRIIAALLLSPNRVVAIDRLVEVAWDGTPPATAHRQVRNRVAALRSILTRHGGIIETLDSGYRIRVGPDALDALPFRRAWSPPAGRGTRSRSGGVGRSKGSVTRSAGTRRHGRRSGSASSRSTRSSPSDELAALVEAYPLRERLVGRLMSALDRDGRRDAAMAVYDDAGRPARRPRGYRSVPELRALHARLSGVAPGPAGPTPRQLPPDVAGFTGRVGDMGRLDQIAVGQPGVAGGRDLGDRGTAGVGKTALAIHWGHQVRDKFPDGQLYVNLRGFSQMAPVRPVDALGGFLRALGVPPERCRPIGRRCALYRDLLADRRLLVFSTTRSMPTQVTPLLPGSTGSLAVVTSRSALVGLPARHLTLEVLDRRRGGRAAGRGSGCTGGWRPSRLWWPSWRGCARTCRWRCGSRRRTWSISRTSRHYVDSYEAAIGWPSWPSRVTRPPRCAARSRCPMPGWA